MDILSKDTLTLLRDSNVRRTVEEVLKKEAGQSSSVTVTVAESDSSDGKQESRQVIVRRLSA